MFLAFLFSGWAQITPTSQPGSLHIQQLPFKWEILYRLLGSLEKTKSLIFTTAFESGQEGLGWQLQVSKAVQSSRMRQRLSQTAVWYLTSIIYLLVPPAHE
jgi:hypothetical protein